MARKGYKTATFTLPDGTRKYVYAKTQEELDEKLFNLKLQTKMGVDLNARITVGELIKLWFETDVAPNVSPQTAQQMRMQINAHLMPRVSAYVAKDVTPVQVKMWLNETGQLNKQSARICFRALKQSFALAEENGLIYKSPVLSRYKPGGWSGPPKNVLTPAEEAELLRVLEGTHAYLLVWFLLATGARRGEACALMWDCVDLEHGVAHLRRNMVFCGGSGFEVNDYMKTHAGTRTVPLPADLCAALAAARKTAVSVFVFTSKHRTNYTKTSFDTMWKTVLRRFGDRAASTSRVPVVCNNIRLTPHILRHTFATRCFEAGLDIKEVQHLMGHANPEVTLKTYTHYCEQARQDETFSKARSARERIAECTTGVPQTRVKSC